MSHLIINGFHRSSNGRSFSADLLRQLDAAGIPFTDKRSDAMPMDGQLIAAASSVAHFPVFRRSVVPDTGPPPSGNPDVPDYRKDPAAAAAEHWAWHVEHLPPELDPTLTIIETVNEPAQAFVFPSHQEADARALLDGRFRSIYQRQTDGAWVVDNLRWMMAFCVETAKLAIRDGYRWAGPGWSPGEPEIEGWECTEALAFLELLAANPGRLYLALHEYSLDVANIRNQFGYLMCRYRHVLAVCDANGIPHPQILITEWGWTYDNVPEPVTAVADILDIGAEYAKDTAVVGAAIWALNGGWGGIADKAAQVVPGWHEEMMTISYPDPEPSPTPPPASGRGQPREQYKRVYWVLPAGVDEATYTAVARQAMAENLRTVGFSYDDAGVGDLDDRTAVLWGISADQQPTFSDWYATHYPGVAVEFRDLPGQPQPPPANIIPVDALSQRDGRWAAVRLGEAGSTQTIGSWGCLLVAYTMMANAMQLPGAPWTPDAMNAHMVARGAFSSQNILPGALAIAFDGVVNEGWLPATDSRMHGRIADKLAAGIPVPARVDFRPATTAWEQHWVLLLGHDGSDYIMADPWTGTAGRVGDTYSNGGVLEALFYGRAAPPQPPAYRYSGPAVRYRSAIHGPASDWMWNMPDLRGMLATLAMPIKYLSNGINADHFQPQPWHLVRAFWQPERKKTPAECWQDIGGDLVRLYQRGARRFELLNEPNLPGEGLGVVWRDGGEFGAWLREFILLARPQLPDAQFYFPGMSPGVPYTNQVQFTNEAWPQVRDLCAGFCLHAYTGTTDNVATAVAEVVDQVVALQAYYNLQVPLVVSECSVNRRAGDEFRAAVYEAIDTRLAQVPGVEAVVWYISHWDPGMDVNYERWLDTRLPQLYRPTR